MQGTVEMGFRGGDDGWNGRGGMAGKEAEKRAECRMKPRAGEYSAGEQNETKCRMSTTDINDTLWNIYRKKCNLC